MAGQVAAAGAAAPAAGPTDLAPLQLALARGAACSWRARSRTFSHSLTAGMSLLLMCWMRYLLLNLGRRISSSGLASDAKRAAARHAAPPAAGGCAVAGGWAAAPAECIAGARGGGSVFVIGTGSQP